ncbi:MAG: DUF3240 family protein [Gallionella sp.]|nr:DUF3240 family protein [Gallionella sp.]
MKNLTLIVHADIQRALADTLHSLEQVTEFTFIQVEGHSPHEEYDPALSVRDRVIGFTPHVRVDILLMGEDVNDVLQALRAADCGLTGHGIYQVTTIEQHGLL